jgi:PAS domain S-box-containing protein
MANEKHSPNINQDSNENMLIEVSADGFCSKVNLATCSLTGFELDEIIGKKFKDFVDLEEYKLKEIEAAISRGNGVVVNFEGNFLKKNGQSLFILWSAYWSIRNKSLVCIGKDLSITEQKLIKANKELNLLNRVNDLLRTGIEGTDLLDLVCNTIIDEGKYHLAWFGLFSQEDGEFTQLKPLSKAGLSKLVDDLNLDFRFSKQAFDPFVESLKVKIPLHENYKNEFPNISNNSLILKKAGISNAIFIPVNFGSLGFGILNICSIYDKPFDFHEIQILERIAENVSLNLRYSASEQLNTANKWNLSKINSELQLLNEVNDIILREKDEVKLLNEVFNLILEKLKYKLAWFSWFQQNDLLKLVLIPQFVWGDSEYADTLSIDFSDKNVLKGPTAQSILTNRTSVINNVLSNPDYSIWKERASQFGIKSSIALNLKFDNNKNAIVGIYSSVENAFDEHEVEILERIMRNLSFAISSIYESKSKEKFKHSLLTSNKQLTEYKIALDKSAIVSITDISGIILDVNENFVKYFGYERNEMIGFTHQILNSKHHPNHFWEELWNTVLAGKIWTGEVKNICKNRSVIWLETTIIPLKNEFGEIHQFYAIRYDITSKKSLRERNQFVGFLVDSTEDSIISLNASGLITSWNNGAEKIYGYSAKEAELKTIYELIPADNINAEIEFISKLSSSTKISETFELNRKRKDGTWVPLSITLSSIEDEDGNLIGVSEIAKDISKIKEAEVELQNQIKFLKDLSFINSFEIKQEVAKLQTMALYVAENYNIKDEFSDIVDQAKRSFYKLNFALEKMNELISSPLKKSEITPKPEVQKKFNSLCIIDNDINHVALLKNLFSKGKRLVKINHFLEVDLALNSMKSSEIESNCLVILDPETENKKGWEFLKQHELLRLNTDILLMSYKFDDIAIERAKDYRNVGNYIQKPVNINQIESIINAEILIWKTNRQANN